MGLFWEAGGDNFKGYVNGALNVGTKGLKVSGDLAVSVILWLWLIQKRGDSRLSHWCSRLGSPWPQLDIYNDLEKIKAVLLL